MKKDREVYPICKDNGYEYAKKVAKMHEEGGELYRPGNIVTVELGLTPCHGSAIPSSDNYGKKEEAYLIIVENDGKINKK